MKVDRNPNLGGPGDFPKHKDEQDQPLPTENKGNQKQPHAPGCVLH